MTIAILGLLLGPVGTFSIFLNTSSPSMTLPEKDKIFVKMRMTHKPGTYSSKIYRMKQKNDPLKVELLLQNL